jgi:hypothetical protein
MRLKSVKPLIKRDEVFEKNVTLFGGEVIEFNTLHVAKSARSEITRKK